MSDGKRIVLTAPLTETIDHAGYFNDQLQTAAAAGTGQDIKPKTRSS
jgi:hypothetical protein